MGITRKRSTSSTIAAIQISKTTSELRLHASCKPIPEHNVSSLNRHLTSHEAPLATF
jgi:hypothetical protein